MSSKTRLAILVVNRAGKRSFMPDILEDFSSDVDIYCVDNVRSAGRWDSIALVIVDIGRAAVSDALDVASSLRHHQSFRSIPILVCAPADENISIQQDRLLESGIFTLIKPFEMDDLRRYIDVLLAWRQELPTGAGAFPSPPRIASQLTLKQDRA